ncbi:MAG: hypothetical protein LC122_13295 [Chitinophagales bacterium]|nr:hypothetical protein [Chitinophagales bacterium]
MIPKKGDRVEIYLKSNLCISGLVKTWTRKKIILESIKDKSTIVFVSIVEIIFYKIFYNEADSKVKEESKMVEQKQENIVDQIINDHNKSLVELRAEEAKVDKKIISEQLKDLTFSRVGNVRYGTPDFSKIKAPK